jgi:outer membrane protein insertion porin family
MVCFLPANVCAEKSIQVGFFPFSIYANNDIKSLKKKLPMMLADEIKKAGAQSVIIDQQYNEVDFDHKRLGKIGIEYGVDYLIVGSLFEAGGRISIDIKMMDVYKSGPVKTFFSQIDGMENLYSAVNQLSKKLISAIFHKRIISKIEIQGNRRIEDDAILRVINIKPEDIVDLGKISLDIKNIYKLGYFIDVKAEREKLDTGIKIIFKVLERPSVRYIKFKGNRKFDEEELKEVVSTGTGSILNIFKINRDTLQIKELYKTKNFHNCLVEAEVKKLKNNQADIIFEINEGQKLKVEEISFEGNKHFSDRKLRGKMKTDEKNWLSFILSAGELDKAELQRDALLIESFYKNKGFMDAIVSEPEIKYGKNSILINFEIREGIRYKVNKVELQGDLILSKKEMFKKIRTDNLKFYSRDVLRNDIYTLTDIYTDKGYAKPDISPIVKRNKEEQQVNFIFKIIKGPPIYFERIIISGNTRTRDKVIRRELKAIETELFSKKKIEKSLRNLQRLNYFDNVEIKPSQGSDENKMDLNIDVSEIDTGSFIFGVGYSSQESLSGSIEVIEGNLFGRGQTIKAKVNISGESALYSIKFIEPWLFDVPLSTGVEIYNQENEYDYYDKDSKGGSLDFSYKIIEDLRIGIKYNYEDFTISNVEPEFTTVDSGRFLTTSVTPSIIYDSRDRRFTPRRGVFSKLSVEYADDTLGGDINFTKSIAEAGFYIPLFWKFTWVIHGKAGHLDDRTEGDPDIDYERFYLGGINSIRGFKNGDIYASFINGEERGGEKLIQFNTEITFPVLEKHGVSAVFFYDQGDVFLENEDFTLSDNFSSFGFGFRWASPMGPMRLEYGIVEKGKEIEDPGSGRIQFSIGAYF